MDWGHAIVVIVSRITLGKKAAEEQVVIGSVDRHRTPTAVSEGGVRRADQGVEPNHGGGWIDHVLIGRVSDLDILCCQREFDNTQRRLAPLNRPG